MGMDRPWACLGFFLNEEDSSFESAAADVLPEVFEQGLNRCAQAEQGDGGGAGVSGDAAGQGEQLSAQSPQAHAARRGAATPAAVLASHRSAP